MQRYALFYDSKEDIQHISANSKGGWVRYDDAQAEIDRLTAALAQEKATSALMFKDTADIVAKLHSERDQALARAAAAAMEMRERAAESVEDWSLYTIEGDPFEALAAEEIRALPIDPDAQKALDRFLDEAREQGDYCEGLQEGYRVGIREAAHLIECDGDALGGKSGAAKAILGLPIKERNE